MFRLFRKLRLESLRENRYAKFLGYITVEVVLVVVGILIAFQIDNWNEDRVVRNRMNHIYSSIKNELTNDLKIAQMVDSVYSLRKEQCNEILKSGLNRREFLEDPYFYFSLPLRSHTVIISPNGYENLMRNIDHVPEDRDTLVNLLNGIHVHLKEMNTKYDYRLDDFTWRIIQRWSEDRDWFHILKERGEPTEEAILYFTEDPEYKNMLAEYKDYLFNASISVKGILHDAPKCIELIESYK